MPRFTHPLVAFARPAVPGASAPRLALGLLGGAVLVIGAVQLSGAGLSATFGHLIPAGDAPVSSAAGMLMLLATFAVIWPVLWLVLPLVHHRSARTLFGPEGRLNWRHFRLGLAVSVGVGIAAWAPFMITRPDVVLQAPDPKMWAVLAAIAVPLIFVQCAAEELVFRGYLLQQFAARSLSVLGWSVLPSVAFAYAHPTEAGLWGLSWFHFVFGLIMAAVTSRTANLGAATGLHVGHNVINLLLIAPAHQAAGLALFLVPEAVDTQGPRVTYLVVMFLGAALFMGIMDLRFIRAWRAARRAEVAAQDDAPTAPPRPMAAE